MDSLVINEGCWDSLTIGEIENSNSVNMMIDDKDLYINKEQAQQIIEHLKTQFEL